MSKRMFVIGAGAVGAYTGGNIARAGADVTFVDPWVEHVETMRLQMDAIRQMISRLRQGADTGQFR